MIQKNTEKNVNFPHKISCSFEFRERAQKAQNKSPPAEEEGKKHDPRWGHFTKTVSSIQCVEEGDRNEKWWLWAESPCAAAKRLDVEHVSVWAAM